MWPTAAAQGCAAESHDWMRPDGNHAVCRQASDLIISQVRVSSSLRMFLSLSLSPTFAMCSCSACRRLPSSSASLVLSSSWTSSTLRADSALCTSVSSAISCRALSASSAQSALFAPSSFSRRCSSSAFIRSASTPCISISCASFFICSGGRVRAWGAHVW